jgi:hypothetical protein
MSLVQRFDHFNVGQNDKNSNEGFWEFFRGFSFFRIVVFLIASSSLLLLASFSFAQQGAGLAQQGRNEPRSKGALPQQMPQSDAKRMELEERRRLRQEIQRHGPDFRSKDLGGTRPVPNALAAPALPSAASVPPPSSAQPAALPPLPSYFGWPATPASNPSPSPSTLVVPTSGIFRGPALSQEERQQLRQQIRDERKRGLYPTPTEADR